MTDTDFVALLNERMKEIALQVLQATRAASTSLPSFDEPSERLRQQLALIKAKDHVTVKEAALLLSCSESHIRKLVMMTRKGKSRRPIPFVDMEGVTVFPRELLLRWASPSPHLQMVKHEAA
ncbi:MAG TPA: helix-turn-helix domain-containing protein [Pyrinomonadaceae bacterium]|nr:helix-turn-helix domain-containing protein [Pyrinomonadaceae bacterium]